MLEQTATKTPAAGIVADDLTGATDSAVQFARFGWAARLALTKPPVGSARPGGVVAVVTDARAAAPAEARSATFAAVESLLASGAQHLFVKIDSTMRGTVVDQIEGALDGWSERHPDAVAIVCSAYPAMGRTIENGQVLVGGARVETTSVGTDPVTPVTTSDLAELLPGSTHVTLGARPTGRRSEALRQAISGGARIITVDASSDEDLAELALAISELGEQAVPVGAAGLAVAMARVWSPTPSERSLPTIAASRVVVVVSSLHDVSRVQSDYLLAQFPATRVLLLSPSLQRALDPAGISAWVERELATRGPAPELIVIASPVARPTDFPEGTATAAELVADSLATVTHRVLESAEVNALMLLGGEGARAVLARLGAHALRVHDTIREGIPLGSVEGGVADGLTIVTKAGGFGEPHTAHEIVTELIASEGTK